MKRILYSLLFPLVLTSLSFTCQAQVISTFAGNGTDGFAGDGGPAAGAVFNNAIGLAVDETGNVYVADQINQRIRKINTAGIITTVAGNGMTGYSGDGGPATAAIITGPQGVVVDPIGTIYFSDPNNNRVRKVDLAGTISTVAGIDTAGYSGDGSLAIAAKLSNPTRLALDIANNLYICDLMNHVIRMVDASGVITTVAGNNLRGYSGDGGPATDAQLDMPRGIAVDAAGNLYIADYNNNRIRKVDPSGDISTVAGTGTLGYSGDGGLATAARLRRPYGIGCAADGTLYIADADNHCVRRVDAGTDVITTLAGTGVSGFTGDGGTPAFAQLSIPTDVVPASSGSGEIYILDFDNKRIRRIGSVTTVTNAVIGTTSRLDVHPNPCHGQVVFNISAPADEQLTIVVSSVTGQVVKQMTTTTNTATELTLNVPAGIYFIAATTAQHRYAGKIVVQ